MELLKLVLVDDEPILLKGLIHTYDWAQMGFYVAGTAQSGEQAITVIRQEKPDVVLTDIRMKQMTGLQMMEEIRRSGQNCLFVVLSAYRDFSYAQQACELGAFAYLLKPIEEEKLQETMQGAYRTCMEQIRRAEKVENLENLVKEDSAGLLQVLLQKYLRGELPMERLREVFETVKPVKEQEDRFITVNADVDLAYQITEAVKAEAAKSELRHRIEEGIGSRYEDWQIPCEDGSTAFLIKTKDNATVREMKQLLERLREELASPIVASISKPYKGMAGIQKSYEEARRLFELACTSGAGTFTIREEMGERTEKSYAAEEELSVIHALRRNEEKALKEAFIRFLYALPPEEAQQRRRMHSLMLQAEVTLEDSYGMTEELKERFRRYYSNMESLSASKEVDVCYRILGKAIEERKEAATIQDRMGNKEYMEAALAYIEEHLQEEELSIVSVAAQIYLNPVYFGRVFKEALHMSFKKYLLQRRMERAKKLLQSGTDSIGSICEQTGIGNPSYFSHLFKEYTGMLPSEYKKEFDV